MLGTKAAIQVSCDIVHFDLDIVRPVEKSCSLGAFGLYQIEMHVTIADMAERRDPNPGDRLFCRDARPLQKFRDTGNRYRHIVPDDPTSMVLCLGY